MDLSFLRECRQLETMMITQYQGPLEKGLKDYLMRSGRSLCTLDLNGCVDVSENLLKTISQACPNLTLLNLGNCTHLSFSHLRHLNKTQITHLCLEGFNGKTEELSESLNLFSVSTNFLCANVKASRTSLKSFRGSGNLFGNWISANALESQFKFWSLFYPL